LTTDDPEKRDSFTPYGSFGRDEMNFAEFPIAALGKRLPDAKTLRFSDTVYGENGKLFPRTITIMASDALGLPTSADEEVVLGFLQLSAENNFQQQTVYFTRYQLLKLLGWKVCGKNDQRLINSLDRWAGITIKYDKAWWDNVEKSWVSETFHIIESVSLYDRERRERRLRMFPNQPNASLSSVKWSDTVFQSLQSGNVKNLNFQFYKSLSTPISRRMFRFLDKRLYSSRPLCMDAKIFAHAHLGMSENHDNYNIRRNLLPAITELEKKGFIATLPSTERFRQISRGKWEVVFSRASLNQSQDNNSPNSPASPFLPPKRGRPKKQSAQKSDDQAKSTPYPIQLGLPESILAKKNYQEPSPERRAEEKKLLEEFRAKKGWKKKTTENKSSEQLDLI